MNADLITKCLCNDGGKYSPRILNLMADPSNFILQSGQGFHVNILNHHVYYIYIYICDSFPQVVFHIWNVSEGRVHQAKHPKQPQNNECRNKGHTLLGLWLKTQVSYVAM